MNGEWKLWRAQVAGILRLELKQKLLRAPRLVDLPAWRRCRRFSRACTPLT